MRRFLHHRPQLAAPDFMLLHTNQAGTLPTPIVSLCFACCTRHTAVLSGGAPALITAFMLLQMKPPPLQQLSARGPLSQHRLLRQGCLQLQQPPLQWHKRSWLGLSWRLSTGKTSAVVALPCTCMTTPLQWTTVLALRK